MTAPKPWCAECSDIFSLANCPCQAEPSPAVTAPELDLDELERLERRATPGPWRVLRETWSDGSAYCDGIEAPSETIVKTDSGVYPPELADADFIAAARNAMPLLIGALKSTLVRLRAAEARVKELEAALLPFASMASKLPAVIEGTSRLTDAGPIAVGGFAGEEAVLTFADIRNAAAALVKR